MQKNKKLIYIICLGLSLVSFFLLGYDFLWIRVILVLSAFLIFIFFGIPKKSDKVTGEFAPNLNVMRKFAFIAGIIAVLLIMFVWMDLI